MPGTTVLYISPQPYFQWRGSPIRVGFNMQALSDLEMKVTLLTLPIGEDREVPNVRVVRVPNLFLRRDIPIGPSFWKLAFDKLLLFWGLAMALRHRYDVVHAVEDAGPIGWFIARCTGARFVFEKHSDPSSYKKSGLRNLVMTSYAAVERFTVRHADAVIGTGPALVAQAKATGTAAALYHIPDIPSSLVEPDAEAAAAHGRDLRQSEAEVLALYVGSFAVYQGIDLLFDALLDCLGGTPPLRAVIVGGSESEIAERKAQLAAAGVGDFATFLGKIPPDDLPSVLAACDVLLSPRIAGNNTPLKLLDYLKAARAIVATDNEANRLILDESNAVLVSPEPAAFARGIRELADDAGQRELLASRGRALIDRTYNFAAFKDGLRACYAGLQDGEKQ